MNARLRHLIGTFPRARVLVVGDLMLDRFVWGDVRRISPEAPVPVVHVARESEHPGGAGNVVANLAALGARPSIVGWIGRDEPGRTLRRLLQGLGADTGGIVAANGTPSIEKTRIIAHSQQVVRLDREPREPERTVADRIRRQVERRVAAASAVVVSDYGKGTIGPALLATLAELRERHDFPYLIDPKQPNFAHYRGATLVKPNQLEAAQATGIEPRDARSLATTGERLLEVWQSESVLISRGGEGMSLCRRGRPPRHFAAAAREVFDVTGAGDTVLAVATLALAGGGTLEEAALLANLAAGVVVGKVGTATLSRSELARAVDEAPAGRRERRR
jgi:D-beta-D-heptose 7-phosphate kinase/D-beta-D-heptose 1-phosphate adenosyltransferase